MSTGIETLEFQAEARQLLQLMIHSIYSEKDIFLRELISNSSDALDRLRLQTMIDKDLQADLSDPHIAIEVDRDQRTLTVRDNGIGMSRDEVVRLIGTIAKSGTAELLQKLRESPEGGAARDLIGQFGVGFYSTFMVADRVTLLTRHAGNSEGTRWESDGGGTYTIEAVPDAPQGTAVTLHLRPVDTEDHLYDYTTESKIREIVKRYSDFISWPVRMAVQRPDGDGGTNEQVETLNSMRALWARSRDEVKQDEYHEFYRHISHDWTDPLEIIQMKAEGTFEYEALLFIPSHAPFDLHTREGHHGIHLYVKRVFIMDDCRELMPDYLRFVKGVVDAQDLSLNISREILQRDRHIQLMRRRLVKKVLATLKELADNDAERHATFWREFGSTVKEGLLRDQDNQQSILDIALFASTNDAEKPTSLRGYIERMREGQEQIYYATGESRTMLENSPHLEGFRAKGLEVLLMTDAVDEMWLELVQEYEGKRFQSISKGEVDLDTEDERKETEPEREQRQKDFEALLSWLGTTLAEQVKEVRLSTRLTTSPACIVGDTTDMSPQLERMYRAMGQPVPKTKRILEINADHPLVKALHDGHTAHPDDPALADTAELLHGLAVLSEGGELTDPRRFTGLLAERLTAAL